MPTFKSASEFISKGKFKFYLGKVVKHPVHLLQALSFLKNPRKTRSRAVSNPVEIDAIKSTTGLNLSQESSGFPNSTPSWSGSADSKSQIAPQQSSGHNSQAFNYDLVQQQTELSVNKVAEYFRSELLMAGEDLLLLEKFNRLTKEQFEEMSSTAQDLLAGGSKMQQAFSDFEPLLNQIDEISLQVDYLELVANELDEYSYDLEEKVKTIRRRKELQRKSHGSYSNAPNSSSSSKR
ncbi:hypothetical protein DSO57_1005336 [Entomophthora muscae]|uniref:Uncharacterized protein n=1 Tax=Entomophthora muscae TaxID=34485 RepID=A0ACC2UU81_9FUNG|nr:hypothetical protein DSO57_1005336 [Entomophthora muscae]